MALLLALVVYAVGAVIYGSGLPVYTWSVLVTAFILFGLYGGTLRRQLKAAKPADNYLAAERMYLVVGFLLKTLVAWQIFAAVLH